MLRRTILTGSVPWRTIPAPVASQSCSSEPAAEENLVEINVNSIGGYLCKVRARLDWTVREAKAAVEAQQPHIPTARQRLLVGHVELRDDSIRLSSVLSAGEVAEVTLVQRTPEQAEWIGQASTEFTQLLVNEEAWSDRDTVLAAVRRCGSSLQHASPDLRGDREIVMAAVLESGLALQFASLALRSDSDIVLAAVATCGRALEFAAPELLAADDFVALAVRRNWRSLEYCSDAHRSNRTLVLDTVAQAGCALSCAANELRDDFEVVAAAVRLNPSALSFASASLRADPDLKALVREGRMRVRRATTDF